MTKKRTPSPPKVRTLNISGTGHPSTEAKERLRNQLAQLSGAGAGDPKKLAIVLDQAGIDHATYQALVDSRHPMDWHFALSMVLHPLEEQARARLFLLLFRESRPNAFLKHNPSLVGAFGRAWLYEAFKGRPPDDSTGIPAEYYKAAREAPLRILEQQAHWRRRSRTWCINLQKRGQSRIPYCWPGLRKSDTEVAIVLCEFLQYTQRHETIPTKYRLRRIIFNGEDEGGIRINHKNFYPEEVNGESVFPDESAAGMSVVFRSAGLHYLPGEQEGRRK